VLHSGKRLPLFGCANTYSRCEVCGTRCYYSDDGSLPSGLRAPVFRSTFEEVPAVPRLTGC